MKIIIGCIALIFTGLVLLNADEGDIKEIVFENKTNFPFKFFVKTKKGQWVQAHAKNQDVKAKVHDEDSINGKQFEWALEGAEPCPQGTPQSRRGEGSNSSPLSFKLKGKYDCGIDPYNVTVDVTISVRYGTLYFNIQRQ